MNLQAIERGYLVNTLNYALQPIYVSAPLEQYIEVLIRELRTTLRSPLPQYSIDRVTDYLEKNAL
ncbi:hypothetical protein GCM10023333_32200 [Ferrimonas pelagia]|uniref:Uncharacterized protein n=2 Tax=Ferrimonas pelagia TaxID=1177826 RepID=A0ABP9FAW8_9GAMM